MNALKLPNLRRDGRSLRERVTAAREATARILKRSNAMSASLSYHEHDAHHPTLRERMKAAASTTARILHFPTRQRTPGRTVLESWSDAPAVGADGLYLRRGTRWFKYHETARYTGFALVADDAEHADTDTELLELGRTYDEVQAELAAFEREVEPRVKKDGKFLSLHEIPDYDDIEERRGGFAERLYDIGAEMAEHTPKTVEGWKLCARVLRTEADEFWNPERPNSEWPHLLAGKLIDAAAVRITTAPALTAHDPIFPAIEAHRAAKAEMDAAKRARADAEAALGEPDWPDGWMLNDELAARWRNDPATQAAVARSSAAMGAEESAMRALIAATPTTDAGRVALARYGCELESAEVGTPGCGASAAYRILAAFARIPEQNAELIEE
jgi:hypothetical protein